MDDRLNTEQLQVVGMGDAVVVHVWQLAQPLCSGEGVELVHVEYQREHGGRILRIFLDKPGGITLDDCAAISRQLGDILDVGLKSEASYRLEVSSPGMPRPLGKLDDFKRFKGQRVKIKTSQPVDGQKNFSGILEDVSGSTVYLKGEHHSVAIAFTDIAKAHITNINGENACS